MHLLDLLPRERIFAPLEADSFRDAMALLVRSLADQGAIREPGAMGRLLTETRLRDVVIVGDRVALPHLRTDAVDRVVVAIGVASRPLDAHELGLDLAPDIVVLILAPPEAATLYLQTVAALARLFRNEGVVERLGRARSPDEILALPELRGLKIQPRLTVRDIMMHRVFSVSPDAPVRDAVDLMVRHRLRALPVVGEKREVLGIVSEWDIMRALLPHIPRAGVPTGPEEFANTMINKDVEQFPVVSEGKLTGFLTRGDIIRKIFGR